MYTCLTEINCRSNTKLPFLVISLTKDDQQCALKITTLKTEVYPLLQEIAKRYMFKKN